jgi:hypothetical protein
MQSLGRTYETAWLCIRNGGATRSCHQWHWFCLDAVLYHGRLLTFLYDKAGEKYGKGKGKGLRILADGKEIGYARQPHRGACAAVTKRPALWENLFISRTSPISQVPSASPVRPAGM